MDDLRMLGNARKRYTFKMRYAVDISHPNDLEWKFVEWLNDTDSLLDLIGSPTFEIFDGLLVRCIGLDYVGAYRGDRCVNLSKISVVMTSVNQSLGSREVSKDFVSFWVDENSPNGALTALSNFIPYDDALEFARQCALKTSLLLPSSLSLMLYMNRQEIRNNFRSYSSKLDSYRGIRSSQQAVDARSSLGSYLDLANSPIVTSSFTNAMFYSKCTLNVTHAEMMKFIREHFPLHQVIEWVTR